MTLAAPPTAPRWVWVGLFAVTVIFRLGFSAVVPHLGILSESEQGLVSQGSDDYEKIARSVLLGYGYRINSQLAPTMLRNPGYVGLLTMAFAVAGYSTWVGHVVQALTAGVVVLLMGRVAFPVIGSRATLLACLAYALYPADWVACARYVVEPLLTVFLLLAILALRSFLARPAWVSALMLGVTCGLMILTKSVAAYLLPFLLIWTLLAWTLFFREQMGSRLLRVGSLGIVAVGISGLVILPWGIYNYARSGHWVFTSTIVGYQFFDANYVNQNRDRSEPREKIWLESRAAARRLAERHGIHPNPGDEWSFEFFNIQDEYAMNELLKGHALADILADPSRYAWGVAHATVEFWYLTRSRGGSLIGMLMNFPVLALGAVGFFACRLWRIPEAVGWVGVVVYLNLVPATGVAVARYALPIMPLVFLFAAAGAVYAWDRRGKEGHVDHELSARPLPRQDAPCGTEGAHGKDSG